MKSDFSHLKKVKPIENEAPDIRDGDVPWSKVFELAANQFDAGKAHSGLCLAVSMELGAGYRYDKTGTRQADRMVAYIDGLLSGKIFVVSWLETRNPKASIDFDKYRAAWARHLAGQFRAKGL